MPPLRLEILHPQTKDWKSIGQINPGDQYGSMSDNNKNGRDVYVFGVNPIEGTAEIKKSFSGVDVADRRTRTVNSIADMAMVASLAPGEEHILNVKTDVSSEPRTIRFTHLES